MKQEDGSAKLASFRNDWEKVIEDSFEKYNLPEYMIAGTKAYILYGLLRPGCFLYHLMSCDFVEICRTADKENSKKLHQWGAFLYCSVPTACYGSEEKIKRWRKTHSK